MLNLCLSYYITTALIYISSIYQTRGQTRGLNKGIHANSSKNMFWTLADLESQDSVIFFKNEKLGENPLISDLTVLLFIINHSFSL